MPPSMRGTDIRLETAVDDPLHGSSEGIRGIRSATAAIGDKPEVAGGSDKQT